MFSVLFIVSASVIAVPDGASIFLLWCVSTISMSESLRYFATSDTMWFIRLTSNDMFEERKIGVFSEYVLIFSSSSSVNPVVAITTGMCF